MYVVVRRGFIHRLQVFPRVLVGAVTLDLLVPAPYASNSVPYAIIMPLSTHHSFTHILETTVARRLQQSLAFAEPSKPRISTHCTAVCGKNIISFVSTSQISRNTKLAVQRKADLQQLAKHLWPV